jgi:outer membrane protein assembly factor BamB
MKDIERLLAEAMRAEGENIEPDIHEARRRFLEKRRKRRFTVAFSGVALAGATIAAAVFVASSVPSPLNEDDVDLAFAVPAVVATASVPGEPQAAAVVADGVWVSNATLGVVSKVDPGSNSVSSSVDVAAMSPGSEPDELVAVGDSLLVTTTKGEVLILDAETGEFAGEGKPASLRGAIEPGAAARPSDTYRLDLDASGDEVWIADENNGALHHFFAAGSGKSDFTSTAMDDIAPDDVAVGDGNVFVLDSERGSIVVYATPDEPGAPTLERTAEPFTVPSGDYMDMRYGFGKLWVSDDSGNVLAYDPSSGELLSTTDVGGRYSDLTIDAESVWALPAGDGDGGRLVALDPETGETRNGGVALDGDPVDVVSGLGSLWVVDRSGDQGAAGPALLRFDPTGEGTPSPEPEETESPEGSASAQPFFAYSAGGDIWLEMTDGTSQQVTVSVEEESAPVFADFGSLIFERHDGQGGSRLILHELSTGEERGVGPIGASQPAVSAGGDLAWVDADGKVHVVPGFMWSNSREGKLEIPLPEGLSGARDLLFSDDAKYLYLQAIGEGWVTVQMNLAGDGAPSAYVLNGLSDQPPGTTYVQPEDANEEGITTLAVCCRETEGDPYSRFSIARMLFTEGGASHQRVTDVVDLENADPGALSMVSLHGALLDETGAWDLFADAKGSWLVTDGSSLWLLSTQGSQELGEGILEPGSRLRGLSLSPYLEGHS